MPGDPHQCRINAARCVSLPQRAQEPEERANFTAMAETWTKLAAEAESDLALFRTISDIESGEPYDALPRALSLGYLNDGVFTWRSLGSQSSARSFLQHPTT
jgi:hypothetical protein